MIRTHNEDMECNDSVRAVTDFIYSLSIHYVHVVRIVHVSFRCTERFALHGVQLTAQSCPVQHFTYNNYI